MAQDTGFTQPSIHTSDIRLPPAHSSDYAASAEAPKPNRRWPKGGGRGEAVIQQQASNIPSLEQSACKSEIAPEGEPKAYPPKHHPILPTDTRRRCHNNPVMWKG